jgi:hypothetical protein
MPLLKKLMLGVNIGTDRNQYAKYEDKDGDKIPDVYDKFPDSASLWLDTDDDGFADNDDFDLNGNNIIDDPDYNEYMHTYFPNIVEQNPQYTFDTNVIPDFAQAYPDEDDVLVYSLDAQLPLIETDPFSLTTYAEIAAIDGYGSGFIFPGFSSKFLIFDAKLEFRNFGDQFLPGYFDRLYDQQRSQVKFIECDNLGRRNWSLQTKESILADVKSSLGWFGYMRANLYDILFIKLAYQDMYGEGNAAGKSLWGSVTVNPTMVPKLKEATLYYSQANVNYINFRYPRNQNAHVMGRLVYALSDNTNLVGKYSEYYNDMNSDGIIEGKDEILEMLTFGVEFTF